MYTLDPARQSRSVFFILVLLAVVGPLSIDLLAPSLPDMAYEFNASVALTQGMVTLFMVGFALSMLTVGPLANRFGHKRVLLCGYAVYLAVTAAMLLTSHMEVMVVLRFVQALAGCFGTALSRAIAMDLYKDRNDIRILALISSALVLVPTLAPVAGGFIHQAWGWQTHFAVMIALGTVLFAAVFLLPVKPAHKHTGSDRANGAFKQMAALLQDGRFVKPALSAAFAFSGAFVFIVGAPFALIEQQHLSPVQFGLVVCLVMSAFMASSALAGRLTDGRDRHKMTRLAASVLFLGAVLAVVTALWGGGIGLVGFIVGMMVYEVGLGIFIPLCQSSAFSHLEGDTATAAGFLFFVEMLVAGVASLVIGQVGPHSTVNLGGVTLCLALLAFVGIAGGRPRTAK